MSGPEDWIEETSARPASSPGISLIGSVLEAERLAKAAWES